MKQALILIFMITMLPSCGKKEDTSCKNRETARLECRAVHTPNYGYQYAQEMCDRSYSAERCY